MNELKQGMHSESTWALCHCGYVTHSGQDGKLDRCLSCGSPFILADRTIASQPSFRNYYGNNHDVDDAPLIAAESDLLDIAEELLAQCEFERVCLIERMTVAGDESTIYDYNREMVQRMDALIDKARAVIAKAHGETP